MARLPRYAAPGIPQHVIQRGNNRSALFVVDGDYQFFRAALREACARYGCLVHAYVFMTNHVHLLMTPTFNSGVSSVMQSVGRRYVRRFNETYRRTGTLWEGRYRATAVDSESYLFACYRYIELNPVRAKIARTPTEYAWSSHEANALGASDSLITPHQSYLELGLDPIARCDAYQGLFRRQLEDITINEIRAATNGGWALGTIRFRDELAAQLERRTAPKPRGRPRRKDEIRL